MIDYSKLHALLQKTSANNKQLLTTELTTVASWR